MRSVRPVLRILEEARSSPSKSGSSLARAAMPMCGSMSAGEAQAGHAPVKPFRVYTECWQVVRGKVTLATHTCSSQTPRGTSKGSMHLTLPRLPAGVGQVRAAGAGWVVRPLCRAQWRQLHDEPTGAMPACTSLLECGRPAVQSAWCQRCNACLQLACWIVADLLFQQRDAGAPSVPVQCSSSIHTFRHVPSLWGIPAWHICASSHMPVMQEPKQKLPVIVAGKDVKEVDNDYFLIPIKILDHEGPLQTDFAIENRLTPQGEAGCV